MIPFENYLLRALELEDLEVLYQSENSLHSFQNHEGFVSRFTLQDYIQNTHLSLKEASQERFVICEKSKRSTVVGFLDVFNYSDTHQRAEIGVVIFEKFQKKNIATQALNTLLEYLKDFQNLHQVYCYIETKNEKSLKLFKKCGFLESGTLKDFRKFKGTFHDVFIFQKIL